jgi:hypothetical protein
MDKTTVAFDFDLETKGQSLLYSKDCPFVFWLTLIIKSVLWVNLPCLRHKLLKGQSF